MKELIKYFIPHHLALLAYQKKFNEPCLAIYQYEKKLRLCVELWDEEDVNHYEITNEKYFGEDKDGDLVTAPSYQQITNWLSEKHDIDIVLLPKYKDKGKFYGGFIQMDDWGIHKSYGSNFNSPTEALDKAIEEGLNKIFLLNSN